MFTAIAKKAATTLAVLLLLVANWSSGIDIPAMEQVDAGMKRALVTFASARALNAAISLLQGTEVTFGLVAEVTVGVGQVMDPVNDLVESFSNLMLVASVAFGIQKVLLAIGQYEYVKIVLTAVLLAWGAAGAAGVRTPRWLEIGLLLFLMARFTVPLAAIGSEAVYSRFLQQDYTEGQETIAAIGASVQDQASPDTLSSLDPGAFLEHTKQLAASATDHLIKLIVVFLLQTVVIPIALVWAVYAVLRSLLLAAPSGFVDSRCSDSSMRPPD